MTDFAVLLQALRNVHFILIGGAAATAHGATRLTQDLHTVYARDSANLTCLASALAPYHPYLRGAPAGLPFVIATSPPVLRT